MNALPILSCLYGITTTLFDFVFFPHLCLFVCLFIIEFQLYARVFIYYLTLLGHRAPVSVHMILTRIQVLGHWVFRWSQPNVSSGTWYCLDSYFHLLLSFLELLLLYCPFSHIPEKLFLVCLFALVLFYSEFCVLCSYTVSPDIWPEIDIWTLLREWAW